MISPLNQKTSGPINAHLTPGPGIYFNAFIRFNAHASCELTSCLSFGRKTSLISSSVSLGRKISLISSSEQLSNI